MTADLSSDWPELRQESTPKSPSDPPPVDAGKDALDQRFAAIYKELRGLAHSVKRHYSNATLSPTALVDEAYLKMLNSPQLGAVSKLHFKRIAGRAMRQILIEAARRRTAQKRGGNEPGFCVTFADVPQETVTCDEQMLTLHEALEELARLNARQAAIVEQRFFGGLTDADIAALLGISPATVHRDWRLARAWLHLQLRGKA